jgi:P-type E1-E2 ATPase
VPDAVDFQSTPGHGVTAGVEGHQLVVGSPRLLEGSAGGPDHDWAAFSVTEFESAGHTAVVVSVDHDPVAVLALADRIRPDAQSTVSELRELTGSAPTLLTGDNLGAATRVATDVGISDVRAGLLPEDKVNAVRQLQADRKRVLVVGDGVNDAPALATADLGLALGRQGSDLALQTADAVIVRDELTTLPVLIAVSRRARRVVIANLAFASTVIVVLVGLDLAGHLPLPLGVAGHEGSTVIVGLNGLRLLSRRSWRIRR